MRTSDNAPPLVAGVLTSLPPQLSRLENLTTLIVSANALTELPDAIASLKKLRNLEAAGNKLSAIPDGVAQCELLQAAEQLQLSALLHLRLPPSALTHSSTPPHPSPRPAHTHTHTRPFGRWSTSRTTASPLWRRSRISRSSSR